MSEYTRKYPYEKTMVLNTIYDAVDTIDFLIDRANSMRGTLITSSVSFPQIGGRVAISPELSKDVTVVEVFPFTDDECQLEWIAAFFDEMQSLMKRAGLEGIN